MVLQQVPRGILCLLSAAHFHGLMRARPMRWWIGIPASLAEPAAGIARTMVVRWGFAGAFAVGLEHARIGGLVLAVTTPARTVVDLLRYAHLVGGEEAGLTAGRALLSRGGRCAELREVATRTGAPAAVRRVIRFLELYGGERP
jgi:predicted transcriptional regulator of viral defense system